MNHLLSLYKDKHLPWATSSGTMEIIREELGEGGVIVLHEGLYTNGDTPTLQTFDRTDDVFAYRYKNIRDVTRTVRLAHANGLKCAMYVNPGACSKLMRWADTLAMIDRHIESFGMDGVFLDGCGFGWPHKDTEGKYVQTITLERSGILDIMRRLRSYYDVLVMHASVPVWVWKRKIDKQGDTPAYWETLGIDEWLYLADPAVLIGEVNRDFGGRIIEGHGDRWFKHMQQDIHNQFRSAQQRQDTFEVFGPRVALKPAFGSKFHWSGQIKHAAEWFGGAYKAGACMWLGPWAIKRQLVSKHYKEQGDGQ